MRETLLLIRFFFWVLNGYVNRDRLSPGINELITKLQSRGTDVYFVSGGFQQLIKPMAESLGVPVDNVFANDLLFNTDGSYRGTNLLKTF